jgi:hypothetical protein
LTSSSPICIPFIFLSCLIALAKSASILLNKSGKSVSLIYRKWLKCSCLLQCCL